jgi:hypothetical protein
MSLPVHHFTGVATGEASTTNRITLSHHQAFPPLGESPQCSRSVVRKGCETLRSGGNFVFPCKRVPDATLPVRAQGALQDDDEAHLSTAFRGVIPVCVHTTGIFTLNRLSKWNHLRWFTITSVFRIQSFCTTYAGASGRQSERGHNTPCQTAYPDGSQKTCKHPTRRGVT